MNSWQEHYKNGYTSFIEHSTEKEWTDCDIIPKLDENGCSDIIIFHFKHSHNPVGIDTPDHVEPGFFHAQAGKYGLWYHININKNLVSVYMYMPDGWKICTRIEKEWIKLFETAKKCIEKGDWNF